MSSLNKAFIKAYRKSEAAPLPAPHTRTAVHVAAPAVAASAAASAATAAAQTAAPPTVTQPAKPVAPQSSTPQAAAPTPAATPQPAATTIAASVPTAAPDAPEAATVLSLVQPAPVTLFDPPHTGVRAPHANFAERGPAPSAGNAPPKKRASTPAPTLEIPPLAPAPMVLPMPNAAGALRPMFEVTNFTWPEIVDQLLAAAPAQFRAATNDLIDAARRHRKMVAVTAAHRGEGCTAVALALARALAEQQQHVILVDGHFDAPALSETLGISAQVGWEDALSGDQPLAEALVESLEDRLTVLPLRQAAADDWRVGVARLKSSLDDLRRHCDLVLIDAGPLGRADDRRHLLSWAGPCRVDRALVVRDVRTTTERDTADLDERLHGCGIAQWHFVENFSAA